MSRWADPTPVALTAVSLAVVLRGAVVVFDLLRSTRGVSQGDRVVG